MEAKCKVKYNPEEGLTLEAWYKDKKYDEIRLSSGSNLLRKIVEYEKELGVDFYDLEVICPTVNKVETYFNTKTQKYVDKEVFYSLAYSDGPDWIETSAYKVVLPTKEVYHLKGDVAVFLGEYGWYYDGTIEEFRYL